MFRVSFNKVHVLKVSETARIVMINAGRHKRVKLGGERPISSGWSHLEPIGGQAGKEAQEPAVKTCHWC